MALRNLHITPAIIISALQAEGIVPGNHIELTGQQDAIIMSFSDRHFQNFSRVESALKDIGLEITDFNRDNDSGNMILKIQDYNSQED